jgi:hypothetical protein
MPARDFKGFRKKIKNLPAAKYLRFKFFGRALVGHIFF